MKAQKLLGLQEWVRLEQAAKHLSGILDKDVIEADVLRLGLDGHLKLSFNFVNWSPAMSGTVRSFDARRAVFFPVWHGNSKGVWLSPGGGRRPVLDKAPELGDEVEPIRGVWDLLMIEDAPRAVERVYHRMTGGPEVQPSVGEGILVVSPEGKIARLQEKGELKHPLPHNIHNYRLSHDLPTEDGVLVIRASALAEFEGQLRAPFVIAQIPKLIGCALHPPNPEESEYAKAARRTAIEEYGRDIEDAVLSGEILALWPATLKPVTNPRVLWPAEARTTRQAMQAFLSNRGVPLTADTLLALLQMPPASAAVILPDSSSAVTVPNTIESAVHKGTSDSLSKHSSVAAAESLPSPTESPRLGESGDSGKSKEAGHQQWPVVPPWEKSSNNPGLDTKPIANNESRSVDRVDQHDRTGRSDAMPNSPEIILPYGKSHVTVEEIPGLIAAALYPRAEDHGERSVSYLIKTTPAAPRGSPLELNDWNYLRDVWGALAPYADGMTQAIWLKYEAAFRAAPVNPGWNLEPVWHNPQLNNAILRADAREQHAKLLREVIGQGSLTTYSHAMVPFPPLEGDIPVARVPVDAFVRYAARFGIGVRVAMKADPRSVRNSASDIERSEESGNRMESPNGGTSAAEPRKQRRNLLDRKIDEAVELAGSCDPAAVFAQLRELALKEEPPLNGVDDQNGSIQWTPAKGGKVRSLTLHALRKRLDRRQIPPPVNGR